MTRNQKIALGCGGAGCLGLIVVVVAGGLIYFFSVSRRTYSTNRNYNYNTNNRNFNLNSNDNDNSSTSTSPSSASASSLSDDDKHKLYQAALMTSDDELLRRVEIKIGVKNEDNTPKDNYEQFLTDHAGWVIRNLSFISSINTADKARAYVDANLPN